VERVVEGERGERGEYLTRASALFEGRRAEMGETAVGSSKSQVTPCLVQLPQTGWSSSHWRVCQLVYLDIEEVLFNEHSYFYLPLLAAQTAGS